MTGPDLTGVGGRYSPHDLQDHIINPSKVSPMPPMLLSMLKKDEILDLIAYVLSGGDKTNAVFAKYPSPSSNMLVQM